MRVRREEDCLALLAKFFEDLAQLGLRLDELSRLGKQLREVRPIGLCWKHLVAIEVQVVLLNQGPDVSEELEVCLLQQTALDQVHALRYLDDLAAIKVRRKRPKLAFDRVVRLER